MITQYSNESQLGSHPVQDKNKRGITVYSISQIQQMTGRGEKGELLTWGFEQPYFYLTIEQRIQMFRLSSPVLGVVSSRMNRLSGLPFNITSEKKKEDEIVEELKMSAELYNEYRDSLAIGHLGMKAKIYRKMLSVLPDIKPDISNFQTALLRWKRRLKRISQNQCDEVTNWLMEPNAGVDWSSFVKKWVFDMSIHGAAAIYKQEMNGRIENFDVLPGGSVYRIKSPYFTGLNGYVQVVPGFIEPQLFFSNELIYSEYLPTSCRNHGMIPLEALINKIAESLFFDDLMAQSSDGTRLPEKMIIVTEANPFGSMDGTQDRDLPLDKPEQKRLEEKINQPIKGGVMTFTGNTATVVDLSRADTMSNQMQRQKDIREEVALVFNMSNMEVNLTGSGDVSGRATAEVQQEIDQGKGIGPIAVSLKNAIERGLLPFRFGCGFKFEFELSKNEQEEKQLDLLMLQTGELTKNEVREKYNKATFGPEYDKPDGTGNQQPGAGQMNPLYTSQI
ncbi:MAG TPA: hypothetical protein DSN98_09025 [Thermoplasmata archaeon]|jgi:hypothetical protein|nr:MAG TPA: hypothetical protein DSN98_09025 [Thermoplasmata archaeon]